MSKQRGIQSVKAYNKKITFHLNFVLEAYLINLTVLIQKSFTGYVFDFSVDYVVVDKSTTLNIHKYLMIKDST